MDSWGAPKEEVRRRTGQMIMWRRGGGGWLLINILNDNLIWTSLHASDKGQINPNMNDTYRKAIAQNRDGIKTHLSIRCILVTFWLLYNVGCGVSLGAEGFSWVELIVDCWEGRLSEEWQRCAQGVYTLYKLMCPTRLDTSFCVFKYLCLCTVCSRGEPHVHGFDTSFSVPLYGVPLYCTLVRGWASHVSDDFTQIWRTAMTLSDRTPMSTWCLTASGAVMVSPGSCQL